MTEIRGLTQALSQNIVQTAGERCSVKRFGDQFCKFDVAAVTRTGVVTEVTSRRFFTVALTPSDDPPVPTYFNGGRIAFTSGKNAGFFREVKRAIVSAGAAQIELWDEMPDDVEVDDTCTLEPGCDKTYETCRDVFQNIVNFRGYGIFIPGALELMKGPT